MYIIPQNRDFVKVEDNNGVAREWEVKVGLRGLGGGDGSGIDNVGGGWWRFYFFYIFGGKMLCCLLLRANWSFMAEKKSTSFTCRLDFNCVV